VIDALLLLALRGGSENALEQIIGKYTAYVCVIIRNTAGAAVTREDIEELAADVFFALWENAGKMKKANLKAYLGAIARNKAKNKLRQFSELLPLEDEIVADDGVTPEDTLIIDEERQTVKSAVLSMDTLDREIFLRHYYGSQTVAAIADGTGTSEAAVKHRLIRGREKLRQIIDREAIG
jgi:RNA polymerase sigma-70 factor (ECF subfamily)